ncbi:MAG: phosphomannomutase/phosphoglucomutase, partial [Gammaproteobacteria bacterium]
MAMLLLIVSGAGIFWVAATAISDTKMDSLGALAKSTGVAIAGQIELINQSLDRIAQDADTVQAVASRNPALLDAAEIRMAHHLPHALNVRLLLPGITELDDTSSPPMTYADLNMVRETFATNRNPLPAIQGDSPTHRHLAIARRVVQGEHTIGVLLASLDDDFIRKSVAQTTVGEGYIQLHQAKLVLGSAGAPPAGENGASLKIQVANTNWALSYGTTASTMTLDTGLMLGFMVIPLMLMAAGFLLGYRKFSALLREDLGSMMKAFKDMMKSNFQGRYPTRLPEMSGFISTLAQYKRILDHGESDVDTAAQRPVNDGHDFDDFALVLTEPRPDSKAQQKTKSPTPERQSGEIFKKPVRHSPAEPVASAPDAEVSAAPTSNPSAEKAADPKDAIFRAYDIRGIVGQALTPEIVYDIGRALGTEAVAHGCKTLVLGRDGRTSSPALCRALADGIITTGCDVLDIGRVPTPVLYFVAHHVEGRSGAMITGSHNPADYNGIKMVVKGETLAEDRIQSLRKCIDSQAFSTAAPGKIENNEHFGNEYIGTVCDDVHLGRPMKVVVDCGNGVAGELAPMLLRTLGCEVIELFCDIDGTFPNHHPDPSKPENLHDLILAVKHYQADLGLAFDGDGDRLGVVDSNGKIIWPDRQMMLYAQNVLTARPGSEIIFDVKCSRHLAHQIKKFGGQPVMWKTGHALMKAKLQETGAGLAGEMSGHIFFNDRWFGFDDALYTAARLIEILSEDTRTSAEVFAALPDSINTPELNVALAEGDNFKLLDKLLPIAKFPGAEITTIDGLRVDFPEGFGLVRASNTTPSLVMRFEADSAAALKNIQ